MNIAVSSCVGGADTYRPRQQPELPQHPVVAVEYDDEDACSPQHAQEDLKLILK